MSPVAADVPSGKTFLGHPRGLSVLFFTEMWERFSYYGMTACLVLYMTGDTRHPEASLILRAQQGLTHAFGLLGLQHVIENVYGHLDIQGLASEIYGLYTAFVYLTPLFGGMLADRVLGQRKSVYIGGVLMAIGQFLLMSEEMFLLGLLFLILGNGSFKPNISTQVGGLYPEGDPRLDRAYTIFYAGINLGAFFSPIICGSLGQLYGWKWGFGAAGAGMVLGLVQYFFGQKYLAPDSLAKAKATNTENAPITPKQWKAIIGFVVLCFFIIVFWMVYAQVGNTLQLFADKNADWHIFGWEAPSTWFQAVNPMCIFILTPLLNLLWAWQARRKKEPPSVIKMAIGCTALGLSFLPLIYITRGISDTFRVSFLWLVGSTFIFTLGEMYLSPIGLSLVVKIAPPRIVSMLMGGWFVAIFVGNYLGGHIGTYYDRMSHPAFFSMLLIASLAAGLAIFALQKPLKNAIGHDT